jgi:hypothetical protein
LNYLVATDSDLNGVKKTAKVKACEERDDVTIVSEDFVNESVKAQKVLDAAKFKLDNAPATATASASNGKGTTSDGAADDAPAEKPKKKRKLEEKDAPAPAQAPVVEEVKEVKVIKKGRAVCFSFKEYTPFTRSKILTFRTIPS